ncbi:MAG: hypothetical protein ACRDL3_01375 [Solirubrobacterales bacterium]
MPAPRGTWTDERLDDLSHRVEHGFSRVDERFDRLEARIDARIDAQGAELSRRIDALGAELSRRIDALGGRVDTQGVEMGGRIDSLQRTMIQFGSATTVGILATLVTVVLTRG